MRVIKRYKNRRLYDTQLRRTVTLGHISDLLKADAPFVVQDNRTAQDVTLAIITQLISKQLQSRRNYPIIPVLGKTLLRKGGENIMNIFKKSLLAGMGVFALSKDRLHQIMDELVKTGQLTEQDKEKLLREWVGKVKAGSLELKGQLETAIRDTVDKVKKANAAEIRKLNSRLDRLAKRLEGLEKKGPTPSGTSTRAGAGKKTGTRKK